MARYWPNDLGHTSALSLIKSPPNQLKLYLSDIIWLMRGLITMEIKISEKLEN